MIVERVYTDGLAQVAWLIGDDDAGLAAVIDPRRDAQIYVQLAQQHGLRIVATLETHIHADFVSGVLELQRLTGAEIYAARSGESDFPHSPVDDGDEISIGAVRLRAYHTPGHTPEHMSYLLFENGDEESPRGIFSGDALFVGEVGRPDLLGEEATEGLVRQLYNTVFNRLSTLPDDVVVYPGHGAGSSCGRSIGSEPTTTIGQEKLGNYAFKPRPLEAFRKAILDDMPPAPSYYPVLKRVNKAGATPLSSLTAGGAIDADTLARVIADGGIVIDARSANEFAARHIPGTLSIGADGAFVTWVGWLAPYGRTVYLIFGSDEQYPDLVTDLYRIGVDDVGGYLDGGVDVWESSGRSLDSYPVISVEELHEEVERDSSLTIIDVRGIDEWKMSHIDGSKHAFLGSLVTTENGLPKDGRLAFICGSGYRSNIAASLARIRGHREVVNVDGGIQDWLSSGYPVVTSER